ncbi:hypothetical protein MNBD_GAMMA12-2201 [hydrothermal vent metagenome]|uniref:Uncharacterized protein n=1 Tax=hydrothermal vent metagenome TaxID=652676 RepID=A0A3B0YEK6_9ZZZZ
MATNDKNDAMVEFESANEIICETCPNKRSPVCKNDEDAMEKSCGVEKKENRKFINKRLKINEKRTRRAKKKRKEPTLLKVRNKNWKDKHCQKLLFNTNPESYKKRMDEMQKAADEMLKDYKDIISDIIKELIKRGILKKARSTLLKGLVVIGCGGVGAVIGFFFGGVGAAPGAVAGVTICGSAAGWITVTEGFIGSVQAKKTYDRLSKEFKEDLKKFKKLKKEVVEFRETINNKQKAKAWENKKLKEMEAAAIANPCLKARACKLVSYARGKETADKTKIPDDIRKKSKGKLGSTNSKMDSTFQLHDTRNCCPGQTGHHLLLNDWLSDSDCTNYNKDAAPTVCVVGYNQHMGNHKTIHDETNDAIENMLGKSPSCQNGFTTKCAIEVATKAHGKAFKESNCDPKCIKFQLEQYYDKLSCSKKLQPTHGGGGKVWNAKKQEWVLKKAPTQPTDQSRGSGI